EQINSPSRFIREVPEELLDRIRPQTKTQPTPNFKSRYSYSTPAPTKVRSIEKEPVGNSGLYVGQQVKHAKFGSGIIINAEGQSEHARVQVKFADHGTKWLVASYAGLMPVK
ncbi:MAG TPA: hypothetical protein VD770_05240, partial [Coxiellaceae bacterium]|nr:hypothetical protein [Coxiellaceae bacterium]